MHILYKNGDVLMPTSSITKNFIVTNKEAAERLLQDIAKRENSKPAKIAISSTNLQKGYELLKYFSFRSKP